MEKTTSLAPSLLYAKSMGTHKYWMPVCTWDALPTFRIWPQSDKNANEWRLLMSKEQVRFICDLWHDLMLKVRGPKKQPSLLARSMQFSTDANWMERLVAYRQLDIWLSNKHTKP
jgi:hypothetical protein